jgi:outer membrane receptor for ferrienterochelin and colicin
MGDLIDQDYGNTTFTARWNHVFSNKLFFNSTSIYSNYNYDLGATSDMFDVSWITNIEDYNQKIDFIYYPNPSNTIKFGGQVIKHEYSPGIIEGMMDTIHMEYEIPHIHCREYGIYLSNEQEITSWLSLQYGIRYSFFENVGPGESYEFDKSDPQFYTVLDTATFEKGDVFSVFNKGWEPRLAIRISTGPTSSIKASYNRMNQYIHLASSSTASLPLNFWFPSSPNIKPQTADQVAAGYFRNFKDNMFETSVEVFYKWYDNTIDFRDHAQLLLNGAYEGELRVGKGWSYGIEFLLRKQVGKLTGWMSYTYSRSFKKIPEINDGNPYPANYDKPHDFAIVLSYDLNDRINFSGNWIYTTAQPRTMPTSRAEYGGLIFPVYSDRNSVRIFPYHRLDLALNWRLNKKKRRFEHFLNFSVYNVYMRKNPVMISFRQSSDDPLVTESLMYYLYHIVPSITYSFNF